MKRNRVSITERKGTGFRQNQTATQKKPTPISLRVMRKKILVNMVSTRSNKEQKAKEKTIEEQSIPVKEADLETPDQNQSIDGFERRETESTPMPNIEEQEKNTLDFSPLGNGDELTNTPETIEDVSQTKKTSSRIAAMVGMKPREKEEITTVTEKSKTFGTVSTIPTKTKKQQLAKINELMERKQLQQS